MVRYEESADFSSDDSDSGPSQDESDDDGTTGPEDVAASVRPRLSVKTKANGETNATKAQTL